MTLTQRISELLQALNNGIPERETCIQLGFLATVIGEPFFIYGRAGSGKTMLINRLSQIFKSSKILKINRHQRTLPENLSQYDLIVFQDFNPSDETLKENVQTALHNRNKTALTISSDQRPESVLNRAEIADQITLTVSLPDSLSPDALCELLQNLNSLENVFVPDELTISDEERKSWSDEIKKVELSHETLHVISQLAELCDQNDIYVPIRKWIALTNIIKAIAFFNGRTHTVPTDTLFLGMPIWCKATSNSVIVENFGNIIKSVMLNEIPEIIHEPYDAKSLYNKVKTLFHSSNNLYETKMFNNEPCLSYRITIAGEPTPLYVPLRYVETDEDFNPFNELRQVETRVRCNYHGTSSCTISIDTSVKNVGLRSSMPRNNSSAGKFEDFATLPSYILKENDPQVAAEKKVKLEECKKEAVIQTEKQTKYLFALRDLYQANKAFREDLFCNRNMFDAIQGELRTIFESNNATANSLKETLELFKNQGKTATV